MTKTVALVVLLLAFTIPSAALVFDTGYLGFLRLAERERWALQMLVDLVIACSVFLGWMWKDAPTRGIARWPYVLLIATLGSVGILAYLIRRRLGGAAAAA